jgi:autoinducer 2 (AI-2) kinase
MNYLLAIDAGTGSVRAVLFDTNGQQIAQAQEEWFHLEEPNVPNSMGFDFTKNWELTAHCIREVLRISGIDPAAILAVSASSMREAIVVYDADGNPLWGVANVDARAASEVKALHETFAQMEAEDYRISGQTFALGALPRLMWLKQHRPELYEKAASMSMISDWVLAKLSGVIATEPSNAGTTGIFSLKARTWAPEMADKVGIKRSLFPNVYEPGTVIGTLTQTAAAQTGLSQQTKVVMGGGDVQLGCAGLGVVDVGQVAVLGGSFWQQVVNIPSELPPPSNMAIRVNPHVIPGQSQAEGITFFSGLVMRWFRDAFCEEEKREAKQQGLDTYAVLEAKAAEVPVGSYGILPIFSDAMNYGKWYHASPSFINLTLDPTQSNKASMFRALEENACMVSSINLDKIEAFTGIKIDTIVFAGGASKGTLWPQILADVTGYRVNIPTVTEATALGTAMAAGVGAGLYPSLQAAAKSLVSWEKTYHPNMAHHATYQAIKMQWQAVYAAQLALVDQNLVRSMWKAPGL